MKMNIFMFRYYLVFLIFWILGLGKSASPFCLSFVRNTGLPPLSRVMSRLRRDISLVIMMMMMIMIMIMIMIMTVIMTILITRLKSLQRWDITADR